MGDLINLSTVLDRPAPKELSGSRERTTLGIAAALLVAEVTLFAAAWDPAHWRPAALVVVLAAFTTLGELAAVRYGPLYISSTSCATVLAIALLGPIPAAAIAAVASALEWIINRKPAWAGIEFEYRGHRGAGRRVRCSRSPKPNMAPHMRSPCSDADSWCWR